MTVEVPTTSVEPAVQQPKKAAQPKQQTKSEQVLKLLRRKRGASISEIEQVTGWKPHSVRGFLSATIRKKMGLQLTSDTGPDGIRRYGLAKD